MKSLMSLNLLLLLIAIPAFGGTWTVDINGHGDFTSIRRALEIARANDTIKVWPGEYRDQLDISTPVVIIGSGYENTKIIVNNDPAITLRTGKIMWFAITSNVGTGVLLIGGQITNCVIRGCSIAGIAVRGHPALISNCVIAENYYGIWVENVDHSSTTVYNSIIYSNSNYGIYIQWGTYSNGFISGNFNCFWGNSPGNISHESRYINTGRDITADPVFVSPPYDYRLTDVSPCVDAGKPDEVDPDGSRSDIGVYGGPDAPIYPEVMDVRLETNPDGTINIRATGKAVY